MSRCMDGFNCLCEISPNETVCVLSLILMYSFEDGEWIPYHCRAFRSETLPIVHGPDSIACILEADSSFLALCVTSKLRTPEYQFFSFPRPTPTNRTQKIKMKGVFFGQQFSAICSCGPTDYLVLCKAKQNVMRTRGLTVHAVWTCGPAQYGFGQLEDIVLLPNSKAVISDCSRRKLVVLDTERGMVDFAVPVPFCPTRVAVDTHGFVYVVNWLDGLINVFSFDHVTHQATVIRTLGHSSSLEGPLGSITDIAVDERGNVIMADRRHEQLVVLGPDGCMHVIDLPNIPHGVSLLSGGRVAVGLARGRILLL